MRTPSLKAIKTFQIAAKHSSFAVAADELCITPSAVSHQIKTLETQLGLPLFSRSARALALTDAGARYLEQIDDLFTRLESVTEQLRARFGRSSVRLHVPAYFASEMLLPRLSEFAKLHAGIDLRIETQSTRGRTHAAEADISVVVGSGPWNGLIAHPLFAQTMVPACSPGLLAEKPVKRYEDLNSHTLLVHEARRDDWDRWAANVGLKALNPAQIVRIDSMSAATRAAEKSIGIALLPAELSRRKFASGRLTRVFDDELVTKEDYTLLVRTDDENRDDIRALCAWLTELTAGLRKTDA
ncbi:MAG TPA: LysR substrate-binding domain-containing protein [Steroidobacteraceae bacterium]|nr:LysR substrate-binding domain-containing protein [Steroidobacteraceae bacterium]